jgi:hypothetical protein
MIARGFDVHPTDGTPAMARLASERLGREVPVMRFDALDAVEAYDALWSQAALLHVPSPTCRRCSPASTRALRPGGVHWASYKDGAGGGRDELRPLLLVHPRGQARSRLPRGRAWSELRLASREGISCGVAGHHLARGARTQMTAVARAATAYY